VAKLKKKSVGLKHCLVDAATSQVSTFSIETGAFFEHYVDGIDMKNSFFRSHRLDLLFNGRHQHAPVF